MIRFEPSSHAAAPPAPLPAVAGGDGHVTQAPAPREDKIAGPDGAFWPVERTRMVRGPAIIRRMAEDIAALARAEGEDGEVHIRDLIALGWREEQVLCFGMTAAFAFSDMAGLRVSGGISPAPAAAPRTEGAR